MCSAVLVERADDVVLLFHGAADLLYKRFPDGDDTELRVILTDTPVHFLFEEVSNKLERRYSCIPFDAPRLIEAALTADDIPDAAKLLAGKFEKSIFPQRGREIASRHVCRHFFKKVIAVLEECLIVGGRFLI